MQARAVSAKTRASRGRCVKRTHASVRIHACAGTHAIQYAPAFARAHACAPCPCACMTQAMVIKADGDAARVDSLKEGDLILSAGEDGTLTTDTVSGLSVAFPEVEATFVAIVTDGNATIALTPEHHMPVGAACCTSLKQGKHIKVGETVWAVEAGAVLIARKVVSKGLVKDKGLQCGGTQIEPSCPRIM